MSLHDLCALRRRRFLPRTSGGFLPVGLPLTRGGHVKVELKDGKIAFDITPAKGAAVKEDEEATA